MEIIQTPDFSDKVYKIFFNAGGRKVVLLEGEDDVITFERIFKDSVDKIYYDYCEGYRNVKICLDEFINEAPSCEAYGIIDRDFRSEAEFLESRKPESKLFILKWYCLEHYLMDLNVLADFMFVKTGKGRFNPVTNDGLIEVENLLVDKALELVNISICDWIVSEKNKNLDGDLHSFIPDGFDFRKIDNCKERVCSELGIAENEFNDLFNNKKEFIIGLAKNKEELSQYISGKRLLIWASHIDVFDLGKNRKKAYRNLLLKMVDKRIKPDELKELIEGRILGMVEPELF